MGCCVSRADSKLEGRDGKDVPVALGNIEIIQSIKC